MVIIGFSQAKHWKKTFRAVFNCPNKSFNIWLGEFQTDDYLFFLLWNKFKYSILQLFHYNNYQSLICCFFKCFYFIVTVCTQLVFIRWTRVACFELLIKIYNSIDEDVVESWSPVVFSRLRLFTRAQIAAERFLGRITQAREDKVLWTTPWEWAAFWLFPRPYRVCGGSRDRREWQKGWEPPLVYYHYLGLFYRIRVRRRSRLACSQSNSFPLRLGLSINLAAAVGAKALKKNKGPIQLGRRLYRRALGVACGPPPRPLPSPGGASFPSLCLTGQSN